MKSKCPDQLIDQKTRNNPLNKINENDQRVKFDILAIFGVVTKDFRSRFKCHAAHMVMLQIAKSG